MYEILEDTSTNTHLAVNIDDICISGKTEKECSELTYQVLERLKKANMIINFAKCDFNEASVKFSGRVIDGSTKTTKQESIEKVRGMREPSDVHSVRQFTGLTSHFRAFIKNYAEIVRPLDKLKKKDTSFEWTEKCRRAFQNLKDLITQNPILQLPDSELPFELWTDASHLGTGAILYQRDKSEPKAKQLRVIGFHSYTFTEAEKNYQNRKVLSSEEVERVLKRYHDDRDSGWHDGCWRTYMKIRSRISCPGLKRQIFNYVKSCDCANRSNPENPRMSLTSQFFPPKLFEIVHLDFGELQNKGKGRKRKRSFLLLVDEVTRVLAGKAMKESTRAVKTFLEKFKRLNSIKTIVTDNGSVFMSEGFKKWALKKSIQLKNSAPYHPASDGLVERRMKDVKQFVKLYENDKNRGTWKDLIDLAIRHNNRSYHSTLGCFPLFKLYGKPVCFPADEKFGLTEKDIHEYAYDAEKIEKIRNRKSKNN